MPLQIASKCIQEEASNLQQFQMQKSHTQNSAAALQNTEGLPRQGQQEADNEATESEHLTRAQHHQGGSLKHPISVLTYWPLD